MAQLSFQDFVSKIQNSRRRLNIELGNQAKVISLKLERAGKINATTDPMVRTGRLRSSIAGLTRTTSSGPEIILKAGGTSEVKYAAFVEFGTPDPPKPRLFYSAEIGGFRYAKKGIKGRFYLARAVDSVSKTLNADLLKALHVSLGD